MLLLIPLISLMSIQINPKPIYQGIALIYLLVLGTVILIFGFADFSVADDVPSPAQGWVIGGAIAIVLAGIFRLWYDAVTVEKEVWSSPNSTYDQPPQNQTTTVENDPLGCAGITSIFGKVLGTIIWLLWLPFLFTQVGEWFYQLSWWIFSTITDLWFPLRFLIALTWGLSYFAMKTFVNCEWLLSRVFFLGFLFPNQILFQYTVIPAIMGIWGRNSYQLLRLSQTRL